MDKQHRCDLMSIFANEKLVKIQAPMVRYSKLPFRMLCREYGCDVSYSPMIIAESFVKSANARDAEFITSSSSDSPLVVQFGAKSDIEFGQAAQLVEKFCDGVNVNCGCPQKWAIKEKIGAYLIDHPQVIRDMVLQKRNLCSTANFPMSVKIRIHDDIAKSVDLVRQIEKAGASYLTIHGRTKHQASSSSVNLDAVKLLREQVSIPVILNGDIFSLQQAVEYQVYTGCHGVMAARGLLKNPALFAGYERVPVHCVRRFVELASLTGVLTFTAIHNHCMFMLHPPVMSHADLHEFSLLTSLSGIVDFLDHRGLWQ